jgi:hypothetical protein
MAFWSQVSAFELALALSTLILASYAGFLHFRLRRQQVTGDARLASLERELQALTNSTLGMGRKLRNFDERIQAAEKNAQDLALPDPVKVSYNEAARLMGLGADIDDIITNCGLSRPEAELVAAMHRQHTSF